MDDYRTLLELEMLRKALVVILNDTAYVDELDRLDDIRTLVEDTSDFLEGK